VSGFDLTALRARSLRGVGKVEPYLLARAGTKVRPRTQGRPRDVSDPNDPNPQELP